MCRVVLVHSVGCGFWGNHARRVRLSLLQFCIFMQMVSTARPILYSQYLSSGWWPLLRQPIIVCSFLDNFASSLRSSLSPFMSYTRLILSWEIPPSGSTPHGANHIVVVVSDVFLCLLHWLQLLFRACLSAISFPTTSHWLGNQVKVIWCPSSWRAARRFRMSLSSALLRSIACWRFAKQGKSDWLSRTIQTFWGGSSVWIICNAFLIAFISA